MKGKLISVSLLLMVALITAPGCAMSSANLGGDESNTPTTSKVEQINLYQDGEVRSLNELEGIPDVLLTTLQELDLQARCAFSQERIDEIKQKDTVMELIFKKPVDITISQFVEPEERHHIATDENGYRILERVKTAIFVLEDKLNEGLWAHVLVGHLIPPKMGSGHEKEWTGYSCWAIRQEESNEIDSSWVYEIASACELEIEAPPPGEDELETIARVSKEESEEIARNYLLNSPTFKFDGIEDSLELAATYEATCPYCWQFVFEFQCRHAGYGDRTGQMLAEVITPHTAGITVDQGEVVSAIMDDQWDMIKQKMIENNTGLPEPEPVETLNSEQEGRGRAATASSPIPLSLSIRFGF